MSNHRVLEKEEPSLGLAKPAAAVSQGAQNQSITTTYTKCQESAKSSIKSESQSSVMEAESQILTFRHQEQSE